MRTDYFSFSNKSTYMVLPLRRLPGIITWLTNPNTIPRFLTNLVVHQPELNKPQRFSTNLYIEFWAIRTQVTKHHALQQTSAVSSDHYKANKSYHFSSLSNKPVVPQNKT